MASVEQCRAALDELAGRLAEVDQTTRQELSLDRTLSCRICDLDVVFSARLEEGRLEQITTDAQPSAQLRLMVSSDDLLALIHGRLSLATAWARGQLRVEAGVRDLLRLRALL
jgi:putative sterol carrier protein